MRTIQMAKLLAGVAVCGLLWAGAARAEQAGPARADCPGAAPGVSLCGKVGTALHACVRDRTCEKKPAARKRSKGGLGFLSRLFI